MNEKMTSELWEILKGVETSSDLENYLSQMDDKLSFSEYMQSIIDEKNLDKGTVIRDSDIPRTYAYQILNGTKNPGRDKVISLCIAMHLTLDETRRALTLSNNTPLYAKDARDSILIFCIHKDLGLIRTNELLYEENQATLE